MRKITTLILLSALAIFADPTKQLPFTKELQVEELPWLAFDAKDNKGTYDKVINSNHLKELIKQKKYRRVVFSFFATWCTLCREGLKQISNNSAELKKNGVLVVLVNAAEKDLDNYSSRKIEEWVKKDGYYKEEFLLVFDKFSNSLEDFGLKKRNNNDEVPLPKTVIADENLRPLMLIGQEGDDYVQLLWK
ncbi:MAG: redoxin domain-containing protein [Fibromonadaceae bacterium]|jgi:thiol-disulfide isomerase/thioredoxin|nr:redoxin domain-containing protein [Fibromonadaceae bacterium]